MSRTNSVDVARSSSRLTTAIRNDNATLQIPIHVHDPPLILPLLRRGIVLDFPRLVKGFEPIHALALLHLPVLIRPANKCHYIEKQNNSLHNRETRQGRPRRLTKSTAFRSPDFDKPNHPRTYSSPQSPQRFPGWRWHRQSRSQQYLSHSRCLRNWASQPH